MCSIRARHTLVGLALTFAASLALPVAADTGPLPCGLKGSVEARLRDCRRIHGSKSVHGSWELVQSSGGSPAALSWLEVHSRLIWGPRLPGRRTQLDGQIDCDRPLDRPYLTGLPTVEEYEAVDRELPVELFEDWQDASKDAESSFPADDLYWTANLSRNPGTPAAAHYYWASAPQGTRLADDQVLRASVSIYVRCVGRP